MMADDKLLRENIAAADPKKVYELYESWPGRAEETLKQKVELTAKKYDRVVYLAVGGSATAGDIISDWMLSSGRTEISVFRGGLPRLKLGNALAIVCSTSGDTSETISMAQAVRNSGVDVVTISHGGRLAEMAAKEGLPHIEIGLAKAPRFSLPYSLFASVSVLRAASLLEGIEWELDDAISVMKNVGTSIAMGRPTPENPAKLAAIAIDHKDPCIYASSVTKSIARRFKNSLNENAKMHARFDSAPDIFHNEVEAWESGDASQHPVILRRKNDPEAESRAFDAFDVVLRERMMAPTRVDAVGRSNLAQLVSLCYTLDFTSYYVAILNGIEPFEISLIDDLKKSR